MHGAEISGVVDATFGAIAARAARYPVIMKSSQLRIIRRKPVEEPADADTGIRWLLVNTQQVNRVLKGAGLRACDQREQVSNRSRKDRLRASDLREVTTDRFLKEAISGASRGSGSFRETFVSDAANRFLKGTICLEA